MKKYLEIYLKNLQKSWNFVSPKKWEPCFKMFLITALNSDSRFGLRIRLM